MALVVVDWSSRRSGSCQHTSGLSVMKFTPRRAAAMWKAQPGAGREVRAVEEDAGVVDQPGHGLTVLVRVDDVLLDPVVLPLLRRQGRGGLLHPPGVLLVDEVRPVAAASLHQFGGGPGEHPLAAVAEDAGPVARQERDVEDPRPLLVLVLEAEPLVRVGRGAGHDVDVTARAPSVPHIPRRVRWCPPVHAPRRRGGRTRTRRTRPSTRRSAGGGRRPEMLDADDGPVELPDGRADRAEERRVAVVEDAAVGARPPSSRCPSGSPRSRRSARRAAGPAERAGHRAEEVLGPVVEDPTVGWRRARSPVRSPRPRCPRSAC